MTTIPANVDAVFASYDEAIRIPLLELRELIIETAAETDGVGELTESLRWGQPAFLTEATKSGSTVRIAPTSKKSTHDYAMFFICHTNLVDRFVSQFGDTFTYDGSRALLFSIGDEHPVDELRECIAMALTYNIASM